MSSGKSDQTLDGVVKLIGGLITIFIFVTGLKNLPELIRLIKDWTSTSTSTPEPATVATRTRAMDGMVMVYVPAGEFAMGSTDGDDNEQPVHTVALDAFWLDQTEVTNAQYRQCIADGPCTPSDCWDDSRLNGDTQPVACVDWEQARTYCEWAGGQLPTEAQWEYAARGPENRVYPWGNEWRTKVANCAEDDCEDGFKYAAPVGSFPDGASWVGALDLAGNVWEWAVDWYGPYAAGRQENPAGPAGGESRVVRGGAFNLLPNDLRAADRYYLIPGNRISILFGFRCVVGSPGK